MLVKGIKDEDFQKVRGFVTVYSNGRVNINTAPQDILYILCLMAGSSLNASEADARGLAIAIVEKRKNERIYFTSSEMNTESIRQRLGLGTIDADNRTKILDYLISSSQIFVAVSENIWIEATGSVNNVRKKIITVYKRNPQGRTKYWHES